MKRPQGAGSFAEPAGARVPGLAEMRALAHPLRLRIMELFAEQPRTTKQVAAILGQPPTRLYHHVGALERAGLLRVTETKKKRGTVERWYEAVAHAMQTPPRSGKRPRRSEASAARRAVALAVLEHSRQELVAAMHRPREQRPIVGRLAVVAPRRKLAAFKKRLSQVLRDVQQEFGAQDVQPAPGDERWALTMVFTPVLRSTRRPPDDEE